MIKYQLWKAVGLDEEGNTIHPELVAEADGEKELIDRAKELALDGRNHYIGQRVVEDSYHGIWKWNSKYYNNSPMRYLNEFAEWHKTPYDDEVRVSGFIIEEENDRSVGIFGSTYELKGDFIFQCKEDLEAFRAKLFEAFEYVSDPLPTIMTFEEREQIIKLEDEHYSMVRPDNITDDEI